MLRRSLLFIPGNNPALLQNAEVFGSDTVIIDLEDAVIIDAKDTARELVSNFLSAFPITKSEVMIRINGLDTEFGLLDLEKVVSDNIDSIMIPKATIEDVQQLSDVLTKLEKERNMKKTIKIVPIVELAKSVLQLETIAQFERVVMNLFLLALTSITPFNSNKSFGK